MDSNIHCSVKACISPKENHSETPLCEEHAFIIRYLVDMMTYTERDCHIQPFSAEQMIALPKCSFRKHLFNATALATILQTQWKSPIETRMYFLDAILKDHKTTIELIFYQSTNHIDCVTLLDSLEKNLEDGLLNENTYIKECNTLKIIYKFRTCFPLLT
jgi:hypothetical protein